MGSATAWKSLSLHIHLDKESFVFLSHSSSPLPCHNLRDDGVSEELNLALVASREAGRGIYAGKLGGLDRASPHDHHLAAAVCTS
jgi:hypothetical protein